MQFSTMCSISVCCFRLIALVVWKLWPEQKFKMKSRLFHKSRADNFRAQKQSKFQVSGTQLDIIEINSGKFPIIPMETVTKELHTQEIANGQTEGLTDYSRYNII